MSERDIFLKAIDLSVENRRAFLEEACGTDAELRHKVEALFAAHEHAGNFLSQPAMEVTGVFSHGENGSVLKRIESDDNHLLGTVLADRYKLLEQIGLGGMGTVYVAEQSQPVRRKVAIKIIKRGMDSSQVLARFEQERQALALMDHPNIAKVLDGGMTKDHRPFFVMEYVKGDPLNVFCDHEKLTVKQRLELFIQICHAVQHAHQKGVIHRDLKPSNILVCLYDGKPVPKVIDFGLAKALHQPLTDLTLHTGHDIVLGTPLYMSPEQAEVNNVDVDTRTDIYALGVILYELLTGTTPLEKQRFKQAAWDEVLRIIREEDPPKPSTKLSESNQLASLSAQRKLEPRQLTQLLSGDLDWIVMKALEKDRARRYETANGFAMDVQRYLADEPVSAGPPSTGYRLRKFVKRNRGKVLAATLVLLALLLGMAGTLFGLVRAERLRLVAEKARAEEEEQRRKAVSEQQRAEEGEKRAESAKKRAEEQSAITQAVNEFLRDDLIGQADTDEQARAGQKADREVSVRVLLDRAAQHVGEKFANKPAIEAAVRQTIGETYRKLGRREEGLPHLVRSLELFRKLNSPDDRETLQVMNNLALMYMDMARYAESEALFNEALAGYQRVYGEESNPTQTVASNLASLYQHLNKFEQAEKLRRRRFEIMCRINGEDHELTVIACHNLADVLRDQKKLEEALPLTKRALEGFRNCYGPDHSGTMSAMNNLAVLYTQMNHPELAEPIMLELLASRRRVQGDNHPRTITAMGNLAGVYTTMQRYSDAQPVLHDALARSRKVQGEDHPITIQLLGNYASLLPKLNRYQECEPLLREYHDKQQRRHGAESQPCIAGQINLGNCLLHTGKLEEAEKLLRQGATKLEKLTPDHWNVFRAQYLLGAVLLEQRNYAKAEPLLISGYNGMKLREKTIPDRDKSFMNNAIDRLIKLYSETNRPEELTKWQIEKENLEKRIIPNAKS